jgi:glutamate/aspartate transport system substrate-binding protein
MTPKTTLAVATVVALIGVSPAPGHAQELPTIQRVRQTGAIVVSHRDVAIPFSYYDAQRRPVGYSIDICMRIVEAFELEKTGLA